MTAVEKSLAAERAIRQFFWRHAEDNNYLGLYKMTKRRLAGLGKIYEMIAKPTKGAEAFIIDFDPTYQPIDQLQVLTWPGQPANPEKQKFVKEILGQAYHLMQGIACDKALTHLLQRHKMGNFPALLVVPPADTPNANFYNNLHQFVSCQKQGEKITEEPMIMVHEWGHMIWSLSGRLLPAKSREDYLLNYALNESHSNTLQYVAAYVAHVSGDSRHWRQLCKRTVLAPYELPDDYAFQFLKAARQIPDLDKKIKDGKIPVELYQGVFRAFAMDPTTYHLNRYTHDEGFAQVFRALPASGLTRTDREMEIMMPFGFDAELAQSIRKADFLSVLDQVDGDKKLVDVLEPSRRAKRNEQLERKVLPVFQSYAAVITAHREGKAELGQLSRVCKEITCAVSYVRGTGEMPEYVLEVLGLKDEQGYKAFIEELRDVAVQDGVNLLRSLRGDLATIGRLPVDKIDELDDVVDNLSAERILQAGCSDVAATVGIWMAYHNFVAVEKNHTSESLAHEQIAVSLVRHLIEAGQSLAIFVPEGDGRSLSVFAEDIGLYKAFDRVTDWGENRFKCASGREAVLAKIGIDPYPPSLQAGRGAMPLPEPKGKIFA